MGDSLHDLESIRYVGLGVCPKDALQEVKDYADLVLNSNAGNGCIYELASVIDEYNREKELLIDMDLLENAYNQHISMFKSLFSNKNLLKNIKLAGELLVDTFKNNNKLLVCGNGGSAADAQHIATEFVSRFYLERKALDAEAITVNTSSLTAISNDYNFDYIFTRQIEAKGKKGDLLIGITTSGKSNNIIKALSKAKSIGMNTVVMTGKEINSELEKYSDILLMFLQILLPCSEAHIFIGIIFVDMLRKYF